MSQDTEADSNLGRTLGAQYRIEALIGEGGMGRVYRGLQLSVNRAVAIKLIGTGTLRDQREALKRFRREAEATARLSHPNTVRLFDFGVTEAQELFMVMELLQGSDLAQYLAEHGPMPLQDALLVTRQVLLALAEAHALGIIHRDLKPDNVFLATVHGSEPIAKVMDFGIAGIEHVRGTGRITATGVIIGTPAYMSPEQAQGQVVDARSDLYSLGVMLFEMLAGRPPFAAATAVSQLIAHVTQPPMRLGDAGVRVPRQASVQALLDRLLAKDPSARPASATETIEVIDALANVRSTKLAPTAQSRPVRGLTSSVQAVVVPKSGVEHGSIHIPRRRGVARFVIGSGLVLGAAGALVLRQLPAPNIVLPKAAAVSEAAKPAPLESVYDVRVATVPSGATVILDGAELGKTPYKLRFKRTTELSLVRAGYQTQSLRVTPESDPTLVVDLVPDKPRVSAELARPRTKPATPSSMDTALPFDSERDGHVATLDRAPADTWRVVEPDAPQVAPPLPAAEFEEQPPAAERPAFELAQPEEVPAPAPPPSAASETARSAALDEPATARDPQEITPGAPRHRPLREVRRALGHFVDRLFGREAERKRREALLNEPSPYPNFPAAQRAYDEKRIDLDRYEDVLWVLKEKRRQRVEAERRNLWHGLITRAEFEARLDRIGAEFRGE